MANDKINFDAAFIALTGNPPFPWQQALYERFISDRPDNIPSSCNLPTGLGKTSVIAIWLIALATHSHKMPRRLVYVVNRRTVVDQTTNEVESIRNQLIGELGPPPLILWQLRELLQGPISPSSPLPLAVSTLRGQFADNREWSADPSRPAIICGTVDMIGSRLLFSGYGVGRNSKPLHAGFLGQDVLLVHDEAHLEPAFQTLIEAIQKEQERCNEFGKFAVMELTATGRGAGEVFTLGPEDERNATVSRRIGAKKAILLHPLTDPKKLADQVVNLALAHKDSGRAVLVFVRKVDDVMKVRDRLAKEKLAVETLTGTLRGKERDELATCNAIFARFMPKPLVDPATGTVYLVCTSAGEVGVNISADHLACDLSTFESMAQRLGRVNRFGDRDDTRIDIVHPSEFEKDDFEQRLEKTLELLRQLSGDGSPAALGKLDPEERVAAFAPTPTILPTSDILFDAWALTTIKDKLPGRPPVEPYLHGLPTDWQPPETQVAWRKEVGIITLDLLNTNKPEDLLEDYPLKPHELLKDRSRRVFERLKKLKASPELPVWIVSNDGAVEVTTLGEITNQDDDAIAYRTVLLPEEAGGLEKGTLTSESRTASDVADDWSDDKGLLRKRIWKGEDNPPKMKIVREIVFDEDSESSKVWLWFVRPKSEDAANARSKEPYPLQPHLDDAKEAATSIVDRLNLPEPLRSAGAEETSALARRRKAL